MSKPTRRLSAQDAAFLYYERGNAPLHIGSLGVFEGRVSFERFVEHLASRIPLIPRYRQRLAWVPFGLAHPTWEDDPSFDVRNHIRRVSLPEPGTDDQLFRLTAELFAPPLERKKPLWEIFVIFGLDGERTGILSKVHHSLVDGVSGIELLMATLDLSPEPAPAPEAPPWEPKPVPRPGARLTNAFWDQLSESREFARQFVEGLIDPRVPLRRGRDVLRALGLASPWLLQPAPRTPFSVALGPERRVAFSEMSFVEIREIRTSLGGTVNDVVLAILAGALRRYLGRHGHRVDGLEPRVAVPVNVRLDEEQGALGNRVSVMVTSLPLGERDAAERLSIIREQMEALKQANQAGGFELLTRAAALAPVPFQMLAGRWQPVNTLINLICTNVPGPMIPLYSVGHPLVAHYPLVPLSLGMGLGVGVTSYNQRLYFGLMADPNAVADIDFLKECVDESFEELRGAAGVPLADLPALEVRANHVTGAGATPGRKADRPS